MGSAETFRLIVAETIDNPEAGGAPSDLHFQVSGAQLASIPRGPEGRGQKM